MIKLVARGLLVALGLWISVIGWAKEEHPIGLIAVSVGDEVVLAEPTSGLAKTVPTGTVAWLFPAPGGILYAPDLIRGKTTVINLRTQVVQDHLDGITMPHFGDLSDRYVVVGRQILVISYPERAVMARLDAEVAFPWQVEVLVGNTIVLILDRNPNGGGDVWMTAAKLDEGRVIFRQALGGDVRHFSLSASLGVMALADAENGQVLVVEPSTLSPIAAFRIDGQPMDLAFVGDGSLLAVAVAGDDGGGTLRFWKIKADKNNALELAKSWTEDLKGMPERMAPSPDGRHVAVGSRSGTLEVFEVDKRKLVSSIDLGGEPRDVVWCDPSIEGPLLPEWSDEKPPEIDLGKRNLP